MKPLFSNRKFMSDGSMKKTKKYNYTIEAIPWRSKERNVPNSFLPSIAKTRIFSAQKFWDKTKWLDSSREQLQSSKIMGV